MIENLQNDNLADIVKENGKVLVQYVLSWCDVCKPLNEAFESLASEHADIKFVTVDGEKNPNSLSMATVESFPTTVFFENGTNKAQTITKKVDVLKEFIAENK